MIGNKGRGGLKFLRTPEQTIKFHGKKEAYCLPPFPSIEMDISVIYVKYPWRIFTVQCLG